ncbi:MAG: P-II family nitrogen regulator [Elusimicrobia bacterium]|nr:P-II family nitrogen regulator [Elusimicrobiota bacterium]
MKEIIAVIRPNQWQKTKSELFLGGFNSITVHRVYGRGKQKGLRYLSKSGSLEEGIVFLPKRMVTIFVNDLEVEPVLKIIERINKTGSIGDGKIFVLPLEEAVRVRTGENGDSAL